MSWRLFLPPELARTQRILDHAKDSHQKAIEALVRAQARLDHARNGAAAKQAARDAASARRTEVEEELQVAKCLAEYFAASWERKEAEAGAAAQALHRAEVELKQAGTAVEAVRRDTGPVVEAKEDADSHLAAATAAYQKAMKKVEEAESKVRAEKEAEAARQVAAANATLAAVAAVAAAAQAAAGAALPAGALAAALPAAAAAALPVAATTLPAAAGAAAAAPAAPAVTGKAVGAASKRRSRSGSRSRSRSGSRRQRRRSRSRGSRRGSGRGRSRSRSRSRDRRRSGKTQSRSRSRDRRRSGGSKRGDAAGPAKLSGEKDGAQRRSASPPHATDPRDLRVARGVRDRFEGALLGCLETKPLPFNVSLINDKMRQQDQRWNVQAELGCQFSTLCQALERDGLLRLRRQGDATWLVVGSRLEARARPPPLPQAAWHRPRPRSPPPAGDGSERWIMS